MCIRDRLGDGVFGGEPQVLPGVDGVLEAGAGEGADGSVLVELALEDAGALEVVDLSLIHIS